MPATLAGAPLGHAMLAEWTLDPEVLYLNHGTVGATPRRVLEEQRRLRDQAELQPARFQLRELAAVRVGTPTGEPPRLRVAADQVAAFVGARGDDLAFVENTTTAVNAVLRSLDWRPGDEIVLWDAAYGAVANAARYVARRAGAAVRTVELPHPIEPDAAVRAFTAALGPRTRLAIVDHITSESALLIPLAEIAARCRARGVLVLADGAHAPGSIPLDLPALGVDWYAGNLHKWAYAPRSSGILWAPPERQAELHPTVISWGLDQGFTAEFDLPGTRDASMHLAAPAGLAFLRAVGESRVRSWNHELAWEAGTWLAGRFDLGLGMPRSMVATMVTVPLPERAGATREQAAALRDALLFEEGIEIQIHAWRGRLWTRISAQVYNEMADVERLADALARRL